MDGYLQDLNENCSNLIVSNVSHFLLNAYKCSQRVTHFVRAKKCDFECLYCTEGNLSEKKSLTITLQDTSCKLDDQADKKSALKSLKYNVTS